MLLLFAALLATASISKASRDCTKTSSDVCRIDMKLDVPETEEELDIFCRSIIRYSDCVKEHEENCDKNTDTLKDISRFASYAQRACDKETSLYRGIADNMECVKRQVLQDTCHLDFDSEEKMRKFDEQLLEQGITVTAKENNNVMFCTSQLFLFACRAMKIGKECGETAKDTITEIFQNLLYPSNACSEEIIDELPIIVRLLNVGKAKEAEDEESIEAEDEEIIKAKDEETNEAEGEKSIKGEDEESIEAEDEEIIKAEDEETNEAEDEKSIEGEDEESIEAEDEEIIKEEEMKKLLKQKMKNLLKQKMKKLLKK